MLAQPSSPAAPTAAGRRPFSIKSPNLDAQAPPFIPFILSFFNLISSLRLQGSSVSDPFVRLKVFQSSHFLLFLTRLAFFPNSFLPVCPLTSLPLTSLFGKDGVCYFSSPRPFLLDSGDCLSSQQKRLHASSDPAGTSQG